MWTKDPRQKLIYSGVIKWARAHAPELILGVATDDDIDRIVEAKQVYDAPEIRQERETSKPQSRLDQVRAKILPENGSPAKPLTEVVLDLCERDNIKPLNVHNWMTANEPSYAGIENLLDAPQKVLRDLVTAWDGVKANFKI